MNTNDFNITIDDLDSLKCNSVVEEIREFKIFQKQISNSRRLVSKQSTSQNKKEFIFITINATKI